MEKRKGFSFLFAAVFSLVLCASGCGSSNTDEWKSGYKPIIEQWEAEKGTDSLGYEFIYLDEDEIPELVTYCYDEAWSGFEMYTFIDGKAVHVDRYDMDGADEMSEMPMTSSGRQGQDDLYVSKTGMLFQTGGMMGCMWMNGYKFEGGKLNKIIEYNYYNNTDWADEPEPISYDIKYKKTDGTIESASREEDCYFENCEELNDIENEYRFSYADTIYLPSDSILSYNEALSYCE